MSKKDSFNATRQAMVTYAGFFKDVAQEIGMEKALALHANQGKAFGSWMVAMLKEELGNKKLNMAAVEAVTLKMAQSLGMEPKIGKKKGVVKAEHLCCPIYEGWAAAGMDHQTIETMCKQITAMEYAEITKAFPQLSASTKFRSAADQPCVEEFVIVK